jgi:hypothetical protein
MKEFIGREPVSIEFPKIRFPRRPKRCIAAIPDNAFGASSGIDGALLF